MKHGDYRVRPLRTQIHMSISECQGEMTDCLADALAELHTGNVPAAIHRLMCLAELSLTAARELQEAHDLHQHTSTDAPRAGFCTDIPSPGGGVIPQLAEVIQ